MIEKLAGLGFRIRVTLLIVGLLLFIIFLLQNTGDIRIEFLVFDGSIPGAILVLVTSAIGFIGFVFGVFTTLNTQRQRRKRHESKLKEKAEAEAKAE